ncbi:MAG: tetratricopeptide repeat protein [Planctomycetes bacterium]|nr:tetratricopeptide repeat protein [Planctomycetota bacterium]MCB9892112.1 tetratricopeptide repeat protein [Planctomycetota bacterium]
MGPDATELTAAEIDRALSAAFGAGDPVTPTESVLKQLGVPLADTAPVFLRNVTSEGLPAPARGRVTGIAGRFQLRDELGRGGLGVVLRGYDVDLGRDVAMKVLHDEHVTDKDMVRRLVEEAQVGGQLQHPGIVPVYEMGIDPDGRPFFAMKLVEGRTLAALLGERRTPTENRDALLTVFVQVCQALGYAHARGVVHRDVKPSNVMVGAFGEVQVVDWGLAKVMDRTAGRQVVIAGTPAYMAPEQARGEDGCVDARSDVFGLGAILCEILTGRAAFTGKSSEETRRAAAAGALEGTWAALAQCGAERELIALAKRCLDPDPGRRPQDGSAVAQAVNDHLASVAERARAAELQVAKAETRAAEERRRRRLVVALAASILVAFAIGGGGYLWYVSQRDTRRIEAETRVQAAIERAQNDLGVARASTTENVTAWQRAETAAREAVALASSPDVRAEVRQRADALGKTATQGIEEARQSAARITHETFLRQRLQTIREERGDDWYDRTARPDAEYAATLRELHIDVDELDTEEAARRIIASPLAEDLRASLHDWIRLLMSEHLDVERDWRALAAIALAAEEDPVRRRLCRSWFEEDLEGLRLLASEPERANWPPATLCMLARQLQRLGDTRTARQVLVEGQRLHPGDLWLTLDLADSLPTDSTEGLQRRIQLLSATVALRPLSPRMRVDLAKALHRAGNHAAARIAVDEALRLRPDGPEVYNELGGLLLASGKNAEAEPILREGLKHGRNAYILTTLGGALHGLGRKEEALELLEEARRLKPDLVVTLANLGPTLRGLDRIDEAEDCLREAIRRRPDFALAHLNLGVLLEENRNDFVRARSEYEEAVRLDPSMVLAWYDLGRMLADQGGFEEALEAHRHAVELSPDEPLYRFHLGHAFFYTGRYVEALEQLRLAENEPPPDRHQHLELMIADCLGQLGEITAAFEHARRALEIEPRHPDTCFDLGRFFARHGRYEEALEAFRYGRDLGDRTSTQAVAQCERALAFADDHQNVLAGKNRVSSPDELVGVANILWHRGELPVAATMIHEVMKAKGDMANLETRLLAAEVAVLAGFGTRDAMPDNEDAGYWRGKAIEWLRMSLDKVKEHLGHMKGTERRYYRTGLLGWRNLPQFAVLRDAERMTKFPEAERREVMAFWMDHSILLEATAEEN